MWSTRRASDGEKGGPNQSFTTGLLLPLPAQAAQWPTPSAKLGDSRGFPSPELAEARIKSGRSNLDDAVAMWPTPNATDGEKAPKTFAGGNMSLPEKARIWTTPSASDGRRGGTVTEAMTGTSLAQQVNSLWMTPRVSEAGQYQYDGGDRSKPKLTLQGQAQVMPTLASILPDRPISTVGEESSHIRRTLNPLFVAWLMGWPFGWTSLALTLGALNDCACSETELSRFKQRMRYELSSLGLPPGAQPAQLGLFG